MLDVREVLDAALAGDLEKVRRGLESGVAVDATVPCALDPASVRFIVAHGGADALPAALPAGDLVGRTALMLAASAGHDAVVAALLAAGASVKERDAVRFSALHLAASAGHVGVCKALLAAKANPHQAGPERMSPLMTAAEAGHERVLEVLLTARATPKQKSVALERAAAAGRVASIAILLRAGADPDLPGEYGFTALGIAAAKHQAEAARALLAGGASPDHVHEGTAPLDVAMNFGAVDVVEALVAAGAKRRKGKPVDFVVAATMSGDERLVRILLDAGYDPNAGKHLGKSALQHALRTGREAIAALLRAAGAREPAAT